jgi:hypothetical protein
MMSEQEPRTFTFINNEKLCAIIESAERHIIYAAPSVAKSVAQSLCTFVERNEGSTLRVIIDADPEPFRLGFGDPDGLALLVANRVDIRRAEGLRIAVLLADKDAWVYSPTPEIIFEQPTLRINNAIQVSIDFAEQILLSMAPDVYLNSEDEILSERTVTENLTAEIGVESVTSQDLVNIDQQLKENPPQKFDASRKVRVYQGYFQFVELSLTGCRLSAHTINIPKSLLNIAEDSDLQNRVRSTCKLVDDTSEFSKKVKVIEDKVRKLRNDYLRSLGPRYGSVILRKQREAFDKEVTAIQLDLKQLSETVKEDIEKEIESSRKKLIKMLLPGFMKNPSKRLVSELLIDLNEVIAGDFIGEELDKEIPAVEDLIGEMLLNCDYKDVTFEMLNDKAFIEAIEGKYKRIKFPKLYSEQETIGKR